MAAPLPDALLDSCAYPERPAAVELRETHISWVFLTERCAYKVKKPVRFPFVDYGTLDRRRAACAEEIRLNRRFAAGLYAGAVSLVPRGPHGLAISHEADPRAVEYAVAMRRYDEAATLAARLTAGTVTEREAEAVGAAIAAWHREAPLADGRGSAARRLGAVARDTVAALASCGQVDARRLAALDRFWRAARAGLSAELTRRAHAGLVRDGHGDLRAEHILLGRRIEAVDGLEFDRDLRATDVAYDLAFLVMDVSRRDHRLARAVVRGYAAAGGEPGSERLLAFMCAVRAMVRAKVDFLRADQLEGHAAADRQQRALELTALAERFAWHARLPAITCVTGIAASGKTTMADALASASGRRVLSSDRLRKAGAGVPLGAHAPADAYSDRASRAVYAELGRRAAAAARRDGGVLVDATFRRGADIAAFVGALDEDDHPAWLVCRAPADVLLERARERAVRPGAISDADWEIVAAQLRESDGRLPRPALAELDTTRPPLELLEALARELDAALAGVPERDVYGARLARRPRRSLPQGARRPHGT